MPARERIDVGDVQLNVLRWPDATEGPRFLLVHGLASNCSTWAAVGDRLHDRGHAVVAVDLRGHGRSDKPDGGYDFATLADDLTGLLDALRWDAAVVAGQSAGGNLAVELAYRRPDRVTAVAGIDGGAIDLQQRWPDWEECAALLAPPATAGTPYEDIERAIRGMHPGWSADAIDATMANFERRADGTVAPWLTRDRHMQVLRSLWEHRPVEQLAQLRMPVLLVPADAGDDWSRHKRDDIERAAAANPGVSVRWFSPADHDIHLQFPDELADVLDGAF